jgi:serine protease inhibitor
VLRSTAGALLCFVALTACGSEPAVQVPVQRISMKLTDASPAFGLKLLDTLLAERDASNVFISPLSASIMLSMAASASQGETRTAMLKALGLDPNVDPSAEIAATIKRLAQSDDNAQLELAQAVWAQKGLALSPTYIQKLREDYRAELANLDFESPDAPAVVNRWVDNATHHKIDQLVDSFPENTVGFLVNATYFHALWATEFKPAGQGDFHTFAGDTRQLPMMRRDDDVIELNTPDYAAALLPYKGARFSALVLLPSQKLSPKDFAGFLTEARWNQAMAYLRQAAGPTFGGKCAAQGFGDAGVTCDGTLVMPKFKLEYKKDLTETLASIGMPMPAGLPQFCDGCALSKVIQKTYLEVDEKGTTAAAATGGMVTTSAPIPLVVDRPFGFALIDNATGAPLFLGVIGSL